MSPYQREFWVESVAILVAIILIPFYMGIVHLGIVEVFAYVAVGAISMSVGQSLRDGDLRLLQLDQLFNEIGLWTLTISIAGGIAYLIALIAI